MYFPRSTAYIFLQSKLILSPGVIISRFPLPSLLGPKVQGPLKIKVHKLKTKSLFVGYIGFTLALFDLLTFLLINIFTKYISKK